MLCIHSVFRACPMLKTTRVLCFKNSHHPPRLHAPWKSSRSQNLVPYFYFSFSISKEKAVVNSNFPAGRGMGDFLMCERMVPPQPPEDSSSQEHLFAPIEASPNWVLGIRSLLFKCPTILQYLFPTCLMAVIAWECSSQGKLFLGPVMAEPRAANAHPESGLGPVAWELKNASFPAQSTRLSTIA